MEEIYSRCSYSDEFNENYYIQSGWWPNRHWGIPQGAGLRRGAGETSLNNGGSSCGHPPGVGKAVEPTTRRTNSKAN